MIEKKRGERHRGHGGARSDGVASLFHGHISKGTEDKLTNMVVMQKKKNAHESCADVCT
jgi:hypothetical protein